MISEGCLLLTLLCNNINVKPYACELRPVSRINVNKNTLMTLFFVVSVFIKKSIKEKKCAISMKHMKSTFTMRV